MRSLPRVLTLLLPLATLAGRTEAQTVASGGAVEIGSSPSMRRAPAPDTPDPATIPTVLAQSLLGGFGMAELTPHFVLGRVPPGWPAALTPRAGLRVVGSATMGPITSVVVAVPRTPSGAASLERLLSAAGYHALDTAGVPKPEGFGWSSSFRGPVAGTAYCGDSARAVSVTPLDSSGMTRHVALVRFEGPGVTTACDLKASGIREPRAEIALRVPYLRAPAGVAVSSSGTSSSGDSFDVRAVADTTLSALALVEHYSAELQRGGWASVGGAVGTTRAATRALSARDAAGTEWQGAVSVHTAGDRRVIHLLMSSVTR